MNIKQKLILLLLCLFITGCETTGRKSSTSLMEQQLDEALQQQSMSSQEPEQPPQDVQQALIPEMPSLNLEEVAEERFDLAVNNSPAREFFLGLVQGSQWNAVVAPDVKGHISLDLKDVTISLVMDIVRDLYGFEYELHDNVYKIYPASLKTVMFPINYLNIKRRGSSVIRVNSGEVADNYSSGPTNNRGNAASNQNRKAGGNNSDSQHSTQIETSTENDFWKELTQTLQLLVSDNPKARIMASPQTSMLIVRALPDELRLISAYLSQIQNVMNRQVIIEARILEVTLGDSFQSGIDWSSITSVNSGNELIFTQNGSVVQNPNTTNLSSGLFNINYQDSNFNLMLDLLSTQGYVQVLSSPRISTLNNQKAVIKVGTDEFFVTDISSTTVAGAGASTTSPDVTLTPFFSGIALDVTPQIDENDEIVLHVHPSISEVDDQEKLLTLGEDQVNLPLAKSSIRESDSIIRAKSGEVVVIGGLMQSQTNDSDSGLPKLKDVPGLGNLFKQRNMKNRKTELVILIRPVVIDNTTYNEYLQNSRNRVRKMGLNGR